MRVRQKKAFAIAVMVLLVNVTLYVYDQYFNRTSGDILGSLVDLDTVGPPLPSDELENELMQRQQLIPTPEDIDTANGTTTKTFEMGISELKAISPADKFLLHSYYRGGASLVAEALNLNHKEIFYLHHPLIALDVDNPNSGTEVLDSKLSKEGIKWLKNIYNCSFQESEKLLEESRLWKSHSIHMNYKQNCVNIPLVDCLEKTCKDRSLRTVYTLKLGLDNVYNLLEYYGEKLKVVVISRDPRAILANRRRDRVSALVTIDDFQTQASKLCQRMGRDVHYAKLINKKFPGSILVLHYEHLVLHPAEVLTYLYDFLGLQVSATRFLKITETMNLQVSEEKRLQLTKSWQLDLTLKESQAVDLGCMYNYPVIGYFPVPKRINSYNRYFKSWQSTIEKDKEKDY